MMSTYAILGEGSTVNVNKDSLEFITRMLQIKIWQAKKERILLKICQYFRACLCVSTEPCSVLSYLKFYLIYLHFSVSFAWGCSKTGWLDKTKSLTLKCFTAIHLAQFWCQARRFWIPAEACPASCPSSCSATQQHSMELLGLPG